MYSMNNAHRLANGKIWACGDAGLQFRVSRVKVKVSVSVRDRDGVRVSDGIRVSTFG